MEEIAACPAGDGWLIAWIGEHEHVVAAFLDSNGAVEAPGIMDTGRTGFAGLSVATDGAGTCLLSWRDSWATIYALRLERGVGMVGSPATLHNDSPYGTYCYECEYDFRDLATAWTGSCFAVLWDSFIEPPTGAKTAGGRDRLHRPRGMLPDSLAGASKLPIDDGFPVLSQWIASDGDPLYATPLFATQVTLPRTILIGTRGTDGYLAIIRDGSGGCTAASYLNAVPLDPVGSIAGPWKSHIAVSEGYLGIWDGELRSMSSVSIRSRPGNTAVGFVYHYSWWGESGSHGEESAVVIERMNPDGSLINAKHYGSADVQSYDFVAGPDTTVVFYTSVGWTGSDPASGALQMARYDGTTLRRWTIDSTEPVSLPTVAALPGHPTKVLLAWLQGGTPRTAVVDVHAPETTITGTPFAAGGLAYGAPRLIPGPNRVLCAFPSNYGGGAGYDIFGVRFDAEGAILDPAPFEICGLPGDQGNVNGDWNGTEFIVTWSNVGVPVKAVYGNRVDSNGIVIDDSGFLISDFGGMASVAGDGAGGAMVGYGGNRLRIVSAIPSPIVLSDLEGSAIGGGVKLTWWAMDGAFDSFIVRMDGGDGLAEVGRVASVPRRTQYEWTDTTLPAGEYRFEVDGLRGDGGWEAIGPVSVKVEAGFGVSVRCIGPIGGGAVRLHLEGPRSSQAAIRIYDVSGRCVRTLDSIATGDGSVDLLWDRQTSAGLPAPGGVYWFEARVGGKAARSRAVLIR
jgi:hypothetical protein